MNTPVFAGALGRRTIEPGNFHAEMRMGSKVFRGRGECQALLVNFPEEALIPVRCQIVLSDLSAPNIAVSYHEHTDKRCAIRRRDIPARLYPSLYRDHQNLEKTIARQPTTHA